MLVHKKIEIIHRCFFWLLKEKIGTLFFLVTKMCAKCLDVLRNLVSIGSVCDLKRSNKCRKTVFPLGQTVTQPFLIRSKSPCIYFPFLQILASVQSNTPERTRSHFCAWSPLLWIQVMRKNPTEHQNSGRVCNPFTTFFFQFIAVLTVKLHYNYKYQCRCEILYNCHVTSFAFCIK